MLSGEDLTVSTAVTHTLTTQIVKAITETTLSNRHTARPFSLFEAQHRRVRRTA